LAYTIPGFKGTGEALIEAGFIVFYGLAPKIGPEVRPALVLGLEMARYAILQGNLVEGVGYLLTEATKLVEEPETKWAAVSVIAVLSRVQWFGDQTSLHPCDQQIFVDLIDRVLAVVGQAEAPGGAKEGAAWMCPGNSGRVEIAGISVTWPGGRATRLR